ncbi:MAG: TraB/GumN family protein [Leptospiraceae bacterium]|nr:TraB/GumN family protein [Leptospiraceae bacterium]MCP5511137.1 TraB/GumN family protein [Leptospiraceae bacterium]
MEEQKIEDLLAKEPIRRLKINDCEVTLLGTAHISQKSVDAVDMLIRTENPDTVCIELCDSRMKSVKNPEHWKQLDIFKVFKDRKMYLLLASMILSSFQKKLGKGDIKPGDEMRKAMTLGEERNLKIVPVDREIQTTLRRAWGNVSFFSKSYLISALISSLLVKEDVSDEKIEEMKSDDMLNDLFSQLPHKFDQIKKVIIDERDQFLAQKIRDASKDSKKLLAVVGAGHLKGIMDYIETDREIHELDEIPKPGFFSKISYFILPAIILSLLAYTVYDLGAGAGLELVYSWILVKGTLSALGALIALAHPYSILLAFLAAPIGNFNPIIKPGWVAALCESWLRKPLVEDFEKIADDSEHFSGYWKNRVIRIFLVLLLPQLGSSIGTFIVTMKGFRELL